MILSERATQVKTSAELKASAETEKMNINGYDVVNLGTGEVDFETPSYIKEAAIRAIEEGLPRYTSAEGNVELRKAICEKTFSERGFECTPENVVITNGGKQAVFNAVFSIVGQGDEVIISAPYWQSYVELVRLAGGTPVIIHTKQEHGYKMTAHELENALTEKTRAIIVNSPNNPTGALYTPEELNVIADFAEKNDLFVISDEVYDKMIYSGKVRFTSIASLGKEIRERTILINSFSKTYSMTPWRIGYSISDRQTAKAMANIQSHSCTNANVASQYAALAALRGGDGFITQLLNELKRRRDYMSQRISDLPYLRSARPLGGLYIFVNVAGLFGASVNNKAINSGRDVSDILLNKYNVATVAGDVFGEPDFIRLSFAPSMESVILGLNRIEKFIKQNF